MPDKPKPNILDNLKADTDLLVPEDDEFFTDPEELSPAAPQILKPQKSSLPAHIKRSHKTEEDEWNFGILTSHTNKLALRVGTKEQAQLKRNRLYNARTYLKYVEKTRRDLLAYEGPLDDWTLCLQERGSVWYVVALNLKLEEGWLEE